MKHGYTTEKNVQIIISLLKQHDINHVVASPGSANMALVASLQSDPYFKMVSAVDERSAAYMACGMAAESGKPVVITCTGATASRNYMPGMTEAFYRKLPVLAITSTQVVSKIGHHVAQVLDRSVIPNDVARTSVTLPVVNSDDEIWDCEIKVNKAILELKRGGGGPAHINLPTTYNHEYVVHDLPNYRIIDRIAVSDPFPEIPKGRVAVMVGSHIHWTAEASQALEKFCESHNAVVFCDHTSSYKGKYRIDFALAGCQAAFNANANAADLMIHIGEVTGDYYTLKMRGKTVWRVSPDGEIRDTFRKLTKVFEMPESTFFSNYILESRSGSPEYLDFCQKKIDSLRSRIPDVPFSNIWVASQIAGKIPAQSSLHFGILNSLRAWNFFDIPGSVDTSSNVGGFGIDGALSTTLGASFARPERLHFCVLGDLAFFYDMNALGNRHLRDNIRILLVNNGKGTEFKQYGHVSANFGDDLDEYVSAGGHFGNQSPDLVKHYAEDLGFTYMSASTKEEFSEHSEMFISRESLGKPIVFEIFTTSDDECEALFSIMNIDTDNMHKTKAMAKSMVKDILGDKHKQLKNFIKS